MFNNEFNVNNMDLIDVSPYSVQNPEEPIISIRAWLYDLIPANILQINDDQCRQLLKQLINQFNILQNVNETKEQDTTGMSKSNKNKAQRLRQLQRKRDDIAIIKKIKDRRGTRGNFEYLVEWNGPWEDTWHFERHLPKCCVDVFNCAKTQLTKSSF